MNEIVKKISEEKFKAYAGLTKLPIVDYFYIYFIFITCKT